MMKKQIALVALLFLGMSCFNASAQFKKFNLGKAIQAGKDAAQAISLSDADIAAMSKEYMEWMDKHNPLTKPDSEYGKRLERLTGNIKQGGKETACGQKTKRYLPKIIHGRVRNVFRIFPSNRHLQGPEFHESFL